MIEKIELVNKNTDLSKLPKPFDWDVYINGQPYYVVKIAGCVHAISSDKSNDLWAYPRNEHPTYLNLIEFNCSKSVSWGIRYEPRNYIRSKWGECEANSGGTIMITRNGKDFCDVQGGLNCGIDKARVMISDFQDHALELNSIDFDKKMIGRKVWWRSEPAIITGYVDGQACVILEPDGIDKFSVPSEFEKDECMYDEPDVKTSILDKHIWWFRD